MTQILKTWASRNSGDGSLEGVEHRTLILPDVVLTFSDVDCGVVPSSSSFSTATKENLLSVTSPSIGTVDFSHNVAADRNFSTLEFLAAARTFAFLWKP
ncbi:hypothetical protein QYF36_004692 [Acer negundo]|nr:hypothetical protein QYF36_004692 [Acer negundo]